MKKLAILFLLTAVLVSFSFAQVSVTADFSLGNVSGANKDSSGADKKMDPALALTFDGAAAKELGPGTLGLAGEITYKISFQDAVGSAHSLTGDNFIKGSYALAAGPGTLTFWLKYKLDYTAAGSPFYVLEPGAEYGGIAAGPATIAVAAFYDYKFDGMSGVKKGAFGDESKVPDVVGIWVKADFDFGLKIKYEFDYRLDHDSSIANIAYLDVKYKVMDPLVIGVELDNTARAKSPTEDQLIFKGFQLKPYVDYTLNDNVSLGAYFKVTNIAADDKKGQDKDIEFTPGVKVTYTF